MKKFLAAVLAVLAVTAATATPAFAGFEKKDGEYYYEKSDGTLAKGRMLIGGDYYYFSAKDGKMLRGGTYKIGDKTYTFGADGKQLGNALSPAPKEDFGIAKKDTGDVLSIHLWNDEIQNILDEYYFPENPLPTGVDLEYIVTPNSDYSERLARTFAGNENIDIFAVEPDKSNLFGEYAVPLSELGLKNSDLSDLYKFTYQTSSDKYGRVMGLPVFAMANALIYRRSIAKDVLGTDKPEEVAKYTNDLNTFHKTAALMEEAGYYALGSPDELFRLYGADNKTPVIKGGKLTIPEAWEKWAVAARAYEAKDYFGAFGAWTDGWYRSISDGKTFAYVGPNWYANYSILTALDSDDEGDWAVTTPPVNGYWGGTYLSVAKGSDNAHLSYEIITGLTLDADMQKTIVTGSTMDGYLPDSPSLRSVTKEFAADKKYNDSRLGGQNPFAVYDKAAQMVNVNPEELWAKDALMLEFSLSMTGYIKGYATYAECLEDFYIVVKEKYPEIKIAK
jgi:ABC-type glycerol-3-phosphate transport system substrate-binding protein